MSSDDQIEDIGDNDNWDWSIENNDFIDSVGEDFRDMDDESCKCLFLSTIAPCTTEAFNIEKKEIGFDFYKLRKELKLNFHQCIILINYIRTMVDQHKSIIDGKQFDNNEDLIKYMKDNNQFSLISLDLDFWNDEKYLVPFNPNDTMLFGFDWEEDDELDDNEIDNILKEAKIEEQSALHFKEQLKNKGIDINDLKQ